MDTLTPYREDIYAWSREQAGVLRGMTLQAGLPNALDLANVAEEIESVGSEVRNAVESFVRLILVHLVKVAVSPNLSAHAHWRGETLNFHAEIQGRYTRSMRQDIDLDVLWHRALRQVRATLSDHGEDMPRAPSSLCPLVLDAFVSEEFDLDGALARVRAALATET